MITKPLAKCDLADRKNNNNKLSTFCTKLIPATSIILISLLSVSCASTTTPAQASTVYNYGENLAPLQQAYRQGDVHILQIGDSHTAGDYFTEQLRKRLQAEIGDGGVGFAYPSKLKGQRNARHGYESDWSTENSRSDKWGGNYPLGGVSASPSSRYSKLNLTSQYYAGDTQNADIVVYGNAGQALTLQDRNGSRDVVLSKSGWQTVHSPITFPTSIQADSNVKVGGFWLKRNGGGVVSAMGINGATQDYWRRWQSDLSQGLSFSQADLVILAYGTNESFRSDASDLAANMNQAIQQVRRGLPNAAILVVGAPESLTSTAGSCGTRATSLDSVQYQLKQVAQQNRTLYWSWQDAMGGSCSMKSWVNRGLAAKDGVHFSRAGYNKAANALYDNLKITLNNAGGVSNSHTNAQAVTSTNYDSGNFGIRDSFSELPAPAATTNVQITRNYNSQSGHTEISNINTNPNPASGSRYSNNTRRYDDGNGNGKICNDRGICIDF